MKPIIYIDNFLAAHGHSPATGYAVAALLQKEGFTVIPASNKKKKLPRLLHMLSVIWQHRNDAVVLIATYSTTAFYFASTCGLLCRWLHISYVPCLHGGNLRARIEASPALSKTYFGKSSMNIAVSPYLQQSLKAKGWPCTLIPNCIDGSQYHFLLRSAAKPKLLWVRSFHQVYNPQMAIHVLYELRKVYADTSLTMVGPDKDGSLAAAISLAESLGVKEHIAFTGWLEQKKWIALAAAHDIFINTTYTDNLPVSVIEAMALGMIVVSTNVGGIPYLINDGINGLLVNANDVKEMTMCIKRVITKEDVAISLSDNAYKTALQYDEQYVIKQWKLLLSKVH